MDNLNFGTGGVKAKRKWKRESEKLKPMSGLWREKAPQMNADDH
jgi:hypothetical protein